MCGCRLSCLVTIVMLWAPLVALAKPDHLVNSTADPGVGDCNDGTCTLREAFSHVSNGDGKEIGCDAAVFPPGSGTEIGLASPLTATVQSGFALDCTGRSILVTAYDVEIESPSGTPLSDVTLRNVAFTHDLTICGGGGGCAQPVSKVNIARVRGDELDILGSSIHGVTVSDSSFLRRIELQTGGAELTSVALVDSQFGNARVNAAGASASKVKIVGNTVLDVIEIDVDADLSDAVVSDNRVIRGHVEIRTDDGAKISVTRNRVNTLQGDTRGIELRASGSVQKAKVESNVVTGDADPVASDDGIVVYSSDDMKGVKIARNAASARGADGIQVQSDGIASGVQVTSNVATGNAGYGIILLLDGHKKTKVQGNLADRNGISGLSLWGSLFDVSKNRVLRNGYAGIDGWNADDSSFKKNEGIGNVNQDMSEQNDCVTNVWKGNHFHTTNADCIR